MVIVVRDTCQTLGVKPNLCLQPERLHNLPWTFCAAGETGRVQFQVDFRQRFHQCVFYHRGKREDGKGAKLNLLRNV